MSPQPPVVRGFSEEFFDRVRVQEIPIFASEDQVLPSLVSKGRSTRSKKTEGIAQSPGIPGGLGNKRL